MKKIIIAVVLIAAVGAVGLMLIKGRSIMSFSSGNFVAGQIMLTNDSSDKISVEYKVDGKSTDKVLSPGEEVACGANGVLRVFTANKAGTYELTYPVDQQGRRLALSQIEKAAKRDQVDAEILSEKGMVGDVKVNHEEPLELQVTY
jgi:hypothetical protein